MQGDEHVDHDELLAQILSGDIHGPRIGLKSAQNSEGAEERFRKQKKDEKKAEKKAEKKEQRKEDRKQAIEDAQNGVGENFQKQETINEWKKNLRKALKGKLVEAPKVQIKTGSRREGTKGGRQRWALRQGFAWQN